MKGLTSTQAADLLSQYGQNIISEHKKKNIIQKFFEQFNNFLTVLLIIASVISFFLGETVDAVLIIAIVVLNAFFGLYQEAKAEESLTALKEMTKTLVRVIRDGRQIEIDSHFLVPGDIVFLEEGVKISADGKVVEAINLEINEAALTGESQAVIKSVKDEAFSGTIVARGRGLMQVEATGDKTKFGQIAVNLATIEDTATPLQKKLGDLTRFIGIGGIVISIAVFIISVFEGSSYFPAFLLAVSLSVAVVPEGLPAVMTITLAIGMKKMADKKAIVRKLSAIEALGSITLIATDKTGTLTENKMQVKELYYDNQLVEVGQELVKTNSANSTNSTLHLLLLNGILCSTASLVYIHDHSARHASQGATGGGSWDVLGDPTEGALLYLGQKVNLSIDEVRNKWKLIDEKPFDSVSKLMSVTVGGEKQFIFTKGAPESVIVRCQSVLIKGKEEKLTDVNRKKLDKQINNWASKGLRVLAFSYKKKTTEKDILLGMVAIHDAPRIEVNDAIAKAKSAGIKVIMITGDNEKTAEAIGVSTGLMKSGDEILVGNQIDQYSDEELLKIISRVKIFARTSPFQKHRIVKLYQKKGEVVAVTGDGVNDAIALKQADVGVAMGRVGTDVARETADMVITDDNFATIVHAIEEGRGIINNIKNAIKYLLSCNVSEAAALVIGLLLGLPTLFYPIQLLYINLVTDGLPALMLSFSPRNPQIMKISPEKEMTLLKSKDQYYIFTIGIIGALIVVVSFFVYEGIILSGLGGTAAFSVLTMIQSFVFIDLWLGHRHIRKNLLHLKSPLFLLAFFIPLVLQLSIISHDVPAAIFRVNSVGVAIYIQFVLISFLVLLGIRGVKYLLKL